MHAAGEPLEEIAFLNGEFVPATEARLPVYDLGVVGGLAVSEMFRTFRHQLFRGPEHLTRFEQSCELLRFPVSTQDLPGVIERVVSHNTARIAPEDDLGVILFQTAGWNPTYVGRAVARDHGPTVCVHTFPLQYELWRDRYQTGVSLRTASVPALPGDITDRRIKSRSRLHWYLAELSVRAIEPGAVPVLLDSDGSITETPAANVCALLDGILVSPPSGSVLEGVSLQATLELAARIGIPCARRRLTVADLNAATEILLTSTPSCLLPVCRWNGIPVGDGIPGPVATKLLGEWCGLTGVDLIRQANYSGKT